MNEELHLDNRAYLISLQGPQGGVTTAMLKRCGLTHGLVRHRPGWREHLEKAHFRLREASNRKLSRFWIGTPWEGRSRG